MVRLLLDGNNSLIALGATRVEVSMKKINNRKTRSDMDAMLKSIFRLFLVCMAIFKLTIFYFINKNLQSKILLFILLPPDYFRTGKLFQ